MYQYYTYLNWESFAQLEMKDVKTLNKRHYDISSTQEPLQKKNKTILKNQFVSTMATLFG